MLDTAELTVRLFYTTAEGINIAPRASYTVPRERLDTEKSGIRADMSAMAAKLITLAQEAADAGSLTGFRPMTPDEVKAYRADEDNERTGPDDGDELG